jgi:transcriptional regulator with XRE-family HTH domain
MYQKYVSLRDSRGVTDYRVAVDTGIPKSTFSEWKNGTYKPKTDKLLKLAEYFGVSIEYFLKEGEP